MGLRIEVGKKKSVPTSTYKLVWKKDPGRNPVFMPDRVFMNAALLVFSTCANREEAERIALTLVNEHLAACVNIMPPVQSVYRWQGAVERAEEWLLLIKTTKARFAHLRDRLEAIHSYDTPEIIATDIVEGSEPYLKWLREQCVEPAY
jgi:periplasmic divalent cation tolerance protein